MRIEHDPGAGVPHADATAEPATRDEAEVHVEAALRDADAPTLLMSLVLMTGDETWLRPALRPTALAPRAPFATRMSDAQAAEVRDGVRRALAAAPTSVPPPDRALLRRMMDFYVGEAIPPEYVDMLEEELAPDGRDARAFRWPAEVPRERLQGFHVTVVGAGLSGILAGIRLREAGIPFTIVEKNPGVGGTWYENAYPGCRVDVPNHFYSYSFKPSHDWSEHFSRQPELLDYCRSCVRDHGLEPHIRYRTELVSARWDPDRWVLQLRGADGRLETSSSQALISAVGMLNRPWIPDLPGQDRFRGPAVHTARWDTALPVEGRRIAVIGSGASAFQLVPELVRQGASVDVFQRSPNWMSPRPNYHDAVSAGKRWVLRHVPHYGRWYRFLLFWSLADAGLPSLKADPAWPHRDRSMNAANDEARRRLTDYMTAQIDPARTDLLQHVIPAYPPGGKRPLTDNGSWLRALQSPRVRLVPRDVRALDEAGVVDAAGEHHRADMVVYATGFQAARYLQPMRIQGEGGQDLHRQWGDEPSTHLGIVTPGFPNLFCLYGPGTNPGHGGSVLFQVECQVRYTMACLAQLLMGPHAAMACRTAVCEDYMRRTREELRQTVWAHPSVRSYYRGASGAVVTNMPWRLIDYWHWTRRPDPTHFLFH